MKTKAQIISYIDKHIANLRCAMVDSNLDKDFPRDLKKTMTEGYKRRIRELEEIKARLEELLI